MAQFLFVTLDKKTGRSRTHNVRYSVESLLDFEECLTCNRGSRAFSAQLEQVVKALRTYKGRKDITPSLHSLHDRGHRFHVR